MGNCTAPQNRPRTHRLDPRLRVLKKSCFRIQKRPEPQPPGFLCPRCSASCFDHGFPSLQTRCACGRVWERNASSGSVDSVAELATSPFKQALAYAPEPPIPCLAFVEIGVFSHNPYGQFGRFRGLLGELFESKLRYACPSMLFELGGVGFKVLSCYPTYGAIDNSTEIMLSDKVLSLTPLAEVTVVASNVDALSADSLLQKLLELSTVHEGEEFCLFDTQVIVTDLTNGNGRVTTSTNIHIRKIEPARECVLAPSDASRFAGIKESQRFEAVRLLGETLSLLRKGRRLIARMGGVLTIGGLTMQVGHLVPREALITGETAVQVVSSLRHFQPPSPQRLPTHHSSSSSKALPPLRPLADSEFDSSAEIVCIICQCALERGCRVISLACTHLYHKECIGPWLIASRECPVCKAKVQ